MREVYGLELWWALTPWVLLGVTVIACAGWWRMAYVLNKSNGRAQTRVKCYQDIADGWRKESTEQHERALKAEAEAREATAAHAECKRNLDTLKTEAADLQNAYYEAHNKLSRLTPRRNKQGRFAPKGKARS